MSLSVQRNMRKSTVSAVLLLAALGTSAGQVDAGVPGLSRSVLPRGPHLRVLPWNGHRAAFTLTFDDGSPSAVEQVLPAIDAEGVKATFFVTVKNLRVGRDDAAWSRAVRDGHEIANHTVDHCHAVDLGSKECLPAEQEIDRCSTYLESHFGVRRVYTFAYPYIDTSPAYKDVASKRFLLARAGSGGLVDASPGVDWYAVDARFISPSRGQTLKDWDAWIDETESQSKWLIMGFHSILPENWYEGVSREDLTGIIEHAKSADDLWIGTFVDVGAYLRAETLFNALKPAYTGKGVFWRWVLPHHYPPGKSLQVMVDSGSLVQRGVALKRDARGSYSVKLDDGSLAWLP